MVSEGLNDRVEQLERSNRQLRQIVSVIAMSVVLFAFVSAASKAQPKVIRADAVVAREFIVPDEHGTGGIRIVVDQRGPAVILARGAYQVQIAVETEPRLVIYSDHAPRAWMGLYDGSANLALAGEKNVGVHLSTARDGPAGALIRDNAGYSAVLGNAEVFSKVTGTKASRSAASLVMFGSDDSVIWSAP